MKCCNKVEAMTKEVNNTDAPERGDNNNKTIVDLIFEDFSTTPSNNPTSSTERNLERSSLFRLREKPKRYCSHKKNLNSKKSSDSILETSDLDFNVIEKKDTHNVSEGVVETGISNQRSNVALGEGLQVLEEELGEGKNEFDEVTNKMQPNEEVNNPVNSLVSAGFETANGKKISISEEGHKSVQNILRKFQGNLLETDYENELKDIKARISIKYEIQV
uniref:Uncharacterized protein n=1 Tax=Glossina pallidipes TaxID=7398 RepID=A0A1A9ZW15_GLOPL